MKELKLLRRSCKINQMQLSEISGISQSEISRLENPNANKTWGSIKRYCNALGYQPLLKFKKTNEDAELV